MTPDRLPDSPPHKPRHGLARLIRACGYSLKGLAAAWRHEAAFREEVLLTLGGVPLAFWLGRTPLDYALLIGVLLILLITELFNSALEALTDRIGTERHELSGRAKDISSAAVFIAIVLVVLVWVAIAWSRFVA
jgi:diacylglycerol kinase (ATP)